ncbi:MAG: NAD(P) transhydrogenase subunit alpha [Alphaproteobacteria bacterium]|nr:NAD(P) transhydrogenase subunit alpha [Alphaproteobacteria bacterium]
MRLGVLKEKGDETRVSVVPGSLKRLLKAGYTVQVEKGAGVASHYRDADYAEAGAELVDRETALGADVIACIRRIDPATVASGKVLCCVADPFRAPEFVKECADRGIVLVSMDMIPRRLSKAQAMDVNSSQDNLAGWKAVVLGAASLSKAVPMMTTSAGTVKPARFVVMGSGVAGLQAIATAKRIGAVVYASDVRLAAKEQIESVGGRFIHVDGMEDFEDASGYAKPLTPEFVQKVNDVVCGVAEDADVIITTARIFGRPAPITVPASAVARFKPGAVVVDMNADVGGNCELTVAGEIVTTENGVTIVGTPNLPGTVATTASMLFSNNVTNFVVTLVKDGAVVVDLKDPILTGPPEGDAFHVPGMGGMLLTHDGKIHPNQTRLAGVLA